MTAPRPEIQRWGMEFGYEGAYMCADSEGEYVTCEDHLRFVTLAKIEVLEEMRALSERNWFCGVKNTEIVDKIAALRKELEG